MLLFPAIDLRGGRCVRLYQGDYGRETVYDDDPVGVARRFADDGARWLHVVDLDGARTGVPANRDAIAAIVAAVGDGVAVQVGGGVRDGDAVRVLLDAGVARVVLGTIAVTEPERALGLAAEYPVVVGLDARDGEAAVQGWTQGTGHALRDLAARYAVAGVEAMVVTEIGRDGTLSGPDVASLATVLEVSGEVDVIASGGVGSLDDLATLANLDVAGRGLAGAIVGTALYEGRFGIREAIAACAPSA